MLSRIRPVFLLVFLALPHTASATALCKSGLVGITLFYGAYNPPGSMPPDTESLKPNSKWPDELIEQGWHNLQKAERPLRLLCRYADGKNETIVLPVTTNTCVLRPGLKVLCD